MMKLIFACITLVGCVSAASLDHLLLAYADGHGGNDATPHEIYYYENVNNGDGNYRSSTNTPESIPVYESDSPCAQCPEDLPVTTEGFSGGSEEVQLTYIVVMNAFQPMIFPIPTEPPIPPLKS